MPAPNYAGRPLKRPATSSEMQVWARTLLTHHDLEIAGRRLTSHSCKRTTLAGSSMFGVSWQDRLILGGHSMGMRSVMTYSRDVVARPILKLEEVLQAVRDGSFRPDETRSGRFVGLGTNASASGNVASPCRAQSHQSEYCPTTPDKDRWSVVERTCLVTR